MNASVVSQKEMRTPLHESKAKIRESTKSRRAKPKRGRAPDQQSDEPPTERVPDLWSEAT
jgi:hypothetical protein